MNSRIGVGSSGQSAPSWPLRSGVQSLPPYQSIFVSIYSLVQVFMFIIQCLMFILCTLLTIRMYAPTNCNTFYVWLLFYINCETFILYMNMLFFILLFLTLETKFRTAKPLLKMYLLISYIHSSRNGNGSNLDRIMHNPTPTLHKVGF